MVNRSPIFRITLFLLILALPVTLFAAPRVGKVAGGGNFIQWSPEVSGYESITLNVLTPEGERISKRFPAGSSMSFNVADLGSKRAEGTYQYELIVEPTLSAGLRKQIADARAAGDEAGARKLLKDAGIEPVMQSGSFVFLNGAIIVEGGQEPGVDVPSMETATQATSAVRPGLTPVTNDQVIPDDLIVQGSACVGLDCVNNENFGFDTIRLKENNLRIHFDDTSTQAGFPANDWRLIANDSASGGSSKFSIEDSTSAKTPFTITAGATTNSIFVDSTGRVGFRTSTPVLDLHVATSNTPAIRLEQNNSGGFTAQTWDIGANEANFFIRDVTGGSKLSLRIRPGAPTSSLDISADGDVGIGKASPDVRMDVVTSDPGDVVLRLQNTDSTGFSGIEFLEDSAVGGETVEGFLGIVHSANEFRFNSVVTHPMTFRTQSAERMRITAAGDVGIGTTAPTSRLHVNGGNITVTGGSFIDDGTTLNVPDYVFDESYKLMSISELSEFVKTQKHLPNVPNIVDVKKNGLNVSQFQMRLLEKVEELTLYTIDQHEQISELKQQIEALKKQVEEKNN